MLEVSSLSPSAGRPRVEKQELPRNVKKPRLIRSAHENWDRHKKGAAPVFGFPPMTRNTRALAKMAL